MKPKLSVIIPVYNEAKHIGNCLSSLQGQTLKPKEIIVIDDSSTDDTKDVILNLKPQTLNLKVFQQKHLGAGSARNLGAQKATGEILVFIDADMEFDPDFLKDLTRPIQLSRTKGTFSKNELVKNWANPWAKAFSFCLGLKDNHLIPKDHPPTSPVFRAILKSEFDRVGGFDTSRGYDDDWSLSERVGYQAIATKAVYYHFNPETLSEIFHQARWRATRKYKLGLLGKIAAVFKLKLIIFKPPFNPVTLLAKITFIFGTKIGLFFPKISK